MRTRTGIPLLVISTSKRTEPVIIKENAKGYQAVFVGDRDIGSPIQGHTYPAELCLIDLKLSIGRKQRIASDAMPVRAIVGKRSYGYRWDDVNKYNTSGKWTYGSLPCVNTTVVISYNEALSLMPGNTAFEGTKESTFYRQLDGSVTNGWIIFPSKRPSRQEWKQYPDIKFASGITKVNWPLFLECIIDKFFSEFNDINEAKKLITSALTFKKHKNRIEKILQGQCFDGTSFDKHDIEVGIGERLLFKGKKDGKPIFAVDSPNYGVALYFFSEYDIAKKWANGQVSAEIAQASAIARIIHSDGWQEKAKNI